eukprot:scaffold93291_cov29-Tisochrysis_lutea.AAC.5
MGRERPYEKKATHQQSLRILMIQATTTASYHSPTSLIPWSLVSEGGDIRTRPATSTPTEIVERRHHPHSQHDHFQCERSCAIAS